MVVRFKEFITEAKFSAQNIGKLSSKIKRVVERKYGQPLFQYGGDGNSFPMARGAVGALFFDPKGRAFQLNWYKPKGSKSIELASINIWPKYVHGDPAPYTVYLNGMNIVEVVDEFVRILKSPKAGKVDIKEELILEKRRTTLDGFRQAANEILGRDAGLTRAEIKQVSDEADLTIPADAYKYKAQRGRFNLFPPISDSRVQGTSTGGQSSLMVIARSPDGKFYRPDEEDAAKAIEQSVKRKLNLGGDRTKIVPTEAEMEDPDTLFGHLRSLVSLVAKGHNPSLFIYGGPGTGKTFVVKKTIEANGLSRNQDYFMVKGKVTPLGLYTLLFTHRKGKLIVFDDADTAFGTEDSANILKAALDSYDERLISWHSNRTINVATMGRTERNELEATIDAKIADGDDKIKFPSEFKFESRIIFISNLPKEKVDTAVLSRSFKIDMTLTDAQMFKRIEGLLPEMGDPDMPLEKKQEIVRVLKERNAMGKLDDINMRTFVAAMSIVKSGVPNWQDLLRFT